MGASDYIVTRPGHLSQRECDLWLGDLQTEDRCMNGNRDGYSGDSQTVEAVRLRNNTLPNANQAQELILEKAEKWSFFVAVYVTDPTLPEGQRDFTVMGGWVAT